jgi:hypothetical protein
VNAQRSLWDAPAPRLKPQAAAVLRVLRERGSLSPQEARVLVGTDRLAARVCEIRRAYGERYVGLEWEDNANGGRHARYFIRRESA